MFITTRDYIKDLRKAEARGRRKAYEECRQLEERHSEIRYAHERIGHLEKQMYRAQSETLAPVPMEEE